MRILSEINIYPIKSLGGIALQEATVERRGLQYDRRWMLVDTAGRFVSQREIAAMALLGTALEPPFLTVFWKTDPTRRLRIPLAPEPESMPETRVRIWDDHCLGSVHDAEINIWFSDQLGQDLRLVFMPDTTHRPADERYAPSGQSVSFADGFPFLVIGQASLDDLNSRLAQPVPMNRFRPNLVFTGGLPYEEDTWRAFQMGDGKYLGVKPCARCIIPTTDQDTAQRAAEPLKTLATYRREGQKILFGQNVVWLGGKETKATVNIGDGITFS